MIQRSELLSSEIRELKQLLEGLPQTSVIQRISLESRLKSVLHAFEQEATIPKPSRARLTFRGRPVVGVVELLLILEGKRLTRLLMHSLL